MDRMTYRITNENRHRLELLRAFAVIGGDPITFQEIVNRAIEDFFESACNAYMRQPENSRSMRETLEELLLQECRHPQYR